jgi:hypothetical protein
MFVMRSVTDLKGSAVRRTWIAGTLVAGLVAGVLCVVPADAVDRKVSAGLVSAADDPSLIAQGKVRTAAGKAAAAGTPVVLYAWPSNDVTAAMAVGDEVKLQQVSESATAADGSFALRIDDLAALQPVMGADKIVNFELTAGQGETAVRYSFARKMSTASGQALLVDAIADPLNPSRPEPPPLLTVDLAAGKVTDSPARPTNTPDPDAIPVDDAKGAPKISCIARLLKDYGPAWTLVGQHYNSTNHVSTVFYYISSATSELGVAYSASGKVGTYKQSGTTARSTNISIAFPAVGDFADRYRYSRFSYGQYYVSCSQGGTVPPLTSYEARPYQFRGGSRSLQPGRTPPFNAAYCDPYERGTIAMIDRTTSVTWMGGVETAGFIGIGMSARTGYSAGAKVQFGFNQDRRLCGSRGTIASGPVELTSWNYF